MRSQPDAPGRLYLLEIDPPLRNDPGKAAIHIHGKVDRNESFAIRCATVARWDERNFNSELLQPRATIGNTVKPKVGAMNRSIIYISSCVAVCALFPSFAHAGCNPPKDVSSCYTIRKGAFLDPSPALPDPPFVVTYPRARKRLVLTHIDHGLWTAEPALGSRNCNTSNTSGCDTLSSTDLAKPAVTNKPGPFLVQFQDGRSFLATHVPTQ